jgi:predicted acyltransferase
MKAHHPKGVHIGWHLFGIDQAADDRYLGKMLRYGLIIAHGFHSNSVLATEEQILHSCLGDVNGSTTATLSLCLATWVKKA